MRTVNVAGPTWTDVMDTMVHGNELAIGLMGAWPPHQKPDLRMAKDDPHLRTWNGAKIRLRAAQSAERFRGPQAEAGWADELDSWNPDKMSASEAFSLFEMGIRLGDYPRIIGTSTPKPFGLCKELTAQDDCHVTTGSTYDNALNLAPRFLKRIRERYEGTSYARQELHGDILEEVDGAIVTRELIDDGRLTTAGKLVRVAVGVDPFGGGGDACGIVVAGRDVNEHGCILADRTNKLGPEGWGRMAVEAAVEFGADVIAVEVNYGGDMCIHVISTAAKAMGVSVRIVKVHSSRGKHLRFEPTGAMYERGEMHHAGSFPDLEGELVLFTPVGYNGDVSPNRADAAVFALTELFPVHEGVGWGELLDDEEDEAA